ncbi:hypothetical protein BT69DRAFT_1276607 [Atractiella rhizophila]|nr:hypothetical protein BT69DRAFT_1276607 [Atractiella rhizophila]
MARDPDEEEDEEDEEDEAVEDWWKGLEVEDIRARCEGYWDPRIGEQLREMGAKVRWSSAEEEEEEEDPGKAVVREPAEGDEDEKREKKYDALIANLVKAYGELTNLPLSLLQPFSPTLSAPSTRRKPSSSSEDDDSQQHHIEIEIETDEPTTPSTLRPPSPFSPSPSPSPSPARPTIHSLTLPRLLHAHLSLLTTLTLELYLKQQSQRYSSKVSSRAVQRGGVESEFQSLSQRIRILKEREEGARRELEKEREEGARRRRRMGEWLEALRSRASFTGKAEDEEGRRKREEEQMKAKVKSERDVELEEARKELFELKALRETNATLIQKTEKYEERLNLMRTALVVATDDKKRELEVKVLAKRVEDLELAKVAESAEVSRLQELEIARLKASNAIKRPPPPTGVTIPMGPEGPGMKRMREEMEKLRARVRELEEAAWASASESE